MANNRMFIVCAECKEKIAIAKFYPQGGFIAGDKCGWWASNPNLQESLNDFFEKHAHEFDKSNFGGCQYQVIYESRDNNLLKQ